MTARATASTGSAWFWEGTTCGAGNLVSFATGTSDWHEALQWRSGRGVLFSWSDAAKEAATYRDVNGEEARVWLVRNEHFDAAAALEEFGRMPPSQRPWVERVYAPRALDEGTRVLVDRLWPRGLRRESGRFDVWAKAVAPSTQLRLWYQHRPERLPEFRRRYEAELRAPAARTAVDEMVGLLQRGALTLVTATRDLSLSAAEILADHVATEARAPGKLHVAAGSQKGLPNSEDYQ